MNCWQIRSDYGNFNRDDLFFDLFCIFILQQKFLEFLKKIRVCYDMDV